MNDFIIDHIRTTPFRLPMSGALRWGAASVLSEARHVLVEVILQDGSIGSAEALPRPTIYGETTASVVAIIAEEISPRLVGKSLDFATVKALLRQIKNNQTAKGAVDMALHEAYARSQGVSLATHLGCVQEKIKVSYILGIADDEEMLRDASAVVAQGVRVLKVKIGRKWQDDLRRIALLQQTFGDEVALYADANETMSAESAPDLLRRLHEANVLYCEEPLPVELISERSQLRHQELLPIIADDSCFSVQELRRELPFNTFDILNIKVARTGYSESAEMLQIARQHNKGVMVGSQAASKLGASRAALFAALSGIDYPSELAFFLKMEGDICSAPLPIVDGYLSVADAVAVSADPDLLREFAIQ